MELSFRALQLPNDRSSGHRSQMAYSDMARKANVLLYDLNIDWYLTPLLAHDTCIIHAMIPIYIVHLKKTLQRSVHRCSLRLINFAAPFWWPTTDVKLPGYFL
mgnify:CR=1 FL=1